MPTLTARTIIDATEHLEACGINTDALAPLGLSEATADECARIVALAILYGYVA